MIDGWLDWTVASITAAAGCYCVAWGAYAIAKAITDARDTRRRQRNRKIVLRQIEESAAGRLFPQDRDRIVNDPYGTHALAKRVDEKLAGGSEDVYEQ